MKLFRSDNLQGAVSLVNMRRGEILTDKQKLKLLEVLLIVGSILAAFKIPDNLIWFFLLFILAGIMLYAALQTGIRSFGWYNLIVFLASISFSAIFTFLFSVSIIKSFQIPYPNWVVIMFLYLFLVTWILYKFLAKPNQRGKQSMWVRIRNQLGICTIIGLIAFAFSVGIFWYTYNLYIANNGKIDWPQTLAIGLSSVSIGIALISLCISLTGGRRIRRLISSDYENFIDLFENVRIDFIEESAKREGRIDRVNIEVLVWKSKQYFDRAIDLTEWVDESKLRHLSEYLKQLVLSLFTRSPHSLIWNRDVSYIVKMYVKLWTTGVINYAEDRIRIELLQLFTTQIGERRPNEDDITLFNRILAILGERDPDATFERIP
jgi:hypothetical protein